MLTKNKTIATILCRFPHSARTTPDYVDPGRPFNTPQPPPARKKRLDQAHELFLFQKSPLADGEHHANRNTIVIKRARPARA